MSTMDNEVGQRIEKLSIWHQ